METVLEERYAYIVMHDSGDGQHYHTMPVCAFDEKLDAEAYARRENSTLIAQRQHKQNASYPGRGQNYFVSTVRRGTDDDRRNYPE
jgi:hypothetical protein